MHIDDEVLNLVAQGNYDAAARLLQSRQGMTLDAAAAEIDRLRVDITPLQSGANPSSADPITPAIAEAIRAGRKIEAIKMYREAHGVGLKAAKDAVEAFEATGRSTSQTQKDTKPTKRGLFQRLFRD